MIAGVAGQPLPGLWPIENWPADFRMDQDETLAGLLRAYGSTADQTKQILAEVADLGQPSAVDPDKSVRWVLLHLIKETARHAGHADIIRETLDGKHAGTLTDAYDAAFWRAWHAQYDDPATSLSRRLDVVRRRVRETLVSRPAGACWRVLSLCAGDGRDLLPELATTTTGGPHVVLVERDATLAGDATATARRLGLDGVTVIEGDAGETATFAAELPVDLLLLCGIFGNVSDEDIDRVIAATPAMLRPGGTVIWTKGSAQPDLRPQLRRRFVEAGLREVAFDSEPNGFGVGVAQLPTVPQPLPTFPARLFTFTR